MKEEITSKKTIQNQKNNVTVKDKITSLFLFYWFWTGFCWLSYFLYFFFSLLSINHKHKCIQTKTFKIQASWSLHSVLINDIVQVSVLVIMTKKKLRKI